MTLCNFETKIQQIQQNINKIDKNQQKSQQNPKQSSLKKIKLYFVLYVSYPHPHPHPHTLKG